MHFVQWQGLKKQNGMPSLDDWNHDEEGEWAQADWRTEKKKGLQDARLQIGGGGKV